MLPTKKFYFRIMSGPYLCRISEIPLPAHKFLDIELIEK